MLFSIKNILREYQAIIIPTSIFLVTALVYGQIVFNDFVYDDYFGIIFNQYVHNSINPITYFTNPGYLFNGNKAPGTYRPLSVWFTAIQIKFFGIDPLYFHFFSLIIHAINAVLVYLVLYKLFENKIGAYLVAILFGIHPIQSEAVAWAFQQSTLLSALFALLSILCAMLALEHKKRYLWIGSYLLTAASILSKDQLVILPILFLLIFFTRGISAKESIKKSIPYLALVIAYFFARVVLEVTFTQVGLWTDRLTLLKVMANGFAYYILLLIWPHPLNVDYDTFDSFGFNHIYLSSSLLAALVIIFYIAFKRRLWSVALGIFWFFLSLATVSNVVFPMLQIINERFVYFPSIGFLTAMIFGLLYLIKDYLALRKDIASFITILLITSLAFPYVILTQNRLKDWENGVTLWQQSARINPVSRRSQHAYAGSLFVDGYLKEAIPQYLFAIYIGGNAPYVPGAIADLLSLFNLVGDDRPAERFGAKFAARDPKNAQIGIVYGTYLIRTKKFAWAERYWLEYEKKFSSNDASVFNLVLAKKMLGKEKDLEKLYMRIKDQETRKQMRILVETYVLLERGEDTKALEMLSEALANHSVLYSDAPYEWLARTYSSRGEHAKAAIVYSYLLTIVPGSVEYQYRLKEELKQDIEKNNSSPLIPTETQLR